MKRLLGRAACAMLLSTAILALPACTSTPTPPIDTSLQSFKPIGYSKRDTCDTQKQIAAHNSVYDTLSTGRDTVYQAPCDRKKPQPAEAKTS